MTTRVEMGGAQPAALGCRIDLLSFPGGNITVPNGLVNRTPVVYDTVSYNQLGATTTTTSIAVPVGGLYVVTVKQPWLSGAGGSRAVELDLNGGDIADVLYPAPAAGAPAYQVTWQGRCAPGDTFSVIGKQDSGVAQTMIAIAFLAVALIGS